jgi:uncharacterized Zn-finger protein
MEAESVLSGEVEMQDMYEEDKSREECIIDENGRYKCTVLGCDKSYNRMDHLRRHALTHTKNKQFSCGECGSCFYTKQHLNRHTLLHLRPKPYLCEFPDCAQAFAKKNQLRKHICEHTCSLSSFEFY